MAEIHIDYIKLFGYIETLEELKNGTNYTIYCTSYFLNHSRGKMFQKTNEFYEKLMSIEEKMIEIIENTIDALMNVLLEFGEAEKEAIEALMENNLMR